MEGTEATSYDQAKGMQLGTAKSPASAITITSSTTSIFYNKKIKSIKVNASTAKDATATLSVKVGNDNCGTESLSDSSIDYTFQVNEATGDIIISYSQPSTSKGLYLKSIEVIYLATSTGDTPSGEVGNGDTDPTPGVGEQEDNGTATFDFNELSSTSGSSDGISFEVVQNTGNAPAYNEGSKEIRVYRYNGLNFSAEEGKTISKIEITFSGENYMGYEFGLNGSTGTYSTEGTIGTWIGSANSVNFLNNGDSTNNIQARIKKIVVTYSKN